MNSFSSLLFQCVVSSPSHRATAIRQPNVRALAASRGGADKSGRNVGCRPPISKPCSASSGEFEAGPRYGWPNHHRLRLWGQDDGGRCIKTRFRQHQAVLQRAIHTLVALLDDAPVVACVGCFTHRRCGRGATSFDDAQVRSPWLRRDRQPVERLQFLRFDMQQAGQIGK
jgi:hypothetical protein